MPIYAYECQACGHNVEAIQKISDVPLKDCAACGKSELKKMLTAPSFRLSGTGWYETDFKKGNKKNIAGDTAPSGAVESTGSSGAGGSAAAPAAAPADAS
jgi:putative FmdB family regulatory protein